MPEDEDVNVPEEKQTESGGSEEWKAIVTFVAIVIFIAIFIMRGFDVSAFILLVTGLIVLSGLNLESKDKQGLLSLVGWILLVIILLSKLNFFIFSPNSPGTTYFLLFVAAFSAFMSMKNALIFFATAVLSIYAFNASFLGFVVLIVVALFIYAATENALFGIVMMVPLLLVGWFVGSGWGYIAEQNVKNIGAQVSGTTGVSTEGLGGQINAMLNDTWMLLTNPNAWYEKQFALQGERDVGATPSALEITKIQALPATVMPRDVFDVVFELTNKGNKDARDSQVGARGETLADACGKVEGKFCNPNCPEVATSAEEFAGCAVTRQLGRIAPGEKRFDSFSFQAPECPGTYSVAASVKYNYTAEGTLNMQMIERSYYEELLRNDKMKWINEMSIASAGPFKLSLRTDRDQPIPDKEIDTATGESKPLVFKAYVGLINEHPGTATFNSVTLQIPSVFQIIATNDDGTDDTTCNIRPAAENLDPTGEYTTYKTIDEALAADRKMSEREWRYYKCRFQLSADEKIPQIKTYFVKAEIKYVFEYQKTTTVTVRQIANIPQKCVKEGAPNLGPSTTVIPTMDKVAEALAKEIFYCWNKNKGSLIDTNAKCRDVKIDIVNCTGATVTAADLKAAIEKINAQYKGNALEDVIYLTQYDADGKNVLLIKINDGNSDVLFSDKYKYDLSLYYRSKNALMYANPFSTFTTLIALLTPNWQELVINKKTPDSKACAGAGKACTGSGEGNCQEGLLCMHPQGSIRANDCKCISPSATPPVPQADCANTLSLPPSMCQNVDTMVSWTCPIDYVQCDGESGCASTEFSVCCKSSTSAPRPEGSCVATEKDATTSNNCPPGKVRCSPCNLAQLTQICCK